MEPRRHTSIRFKENRVNCLLQHFLLLELNFVFQVSFLFGFLVLHSPNSSDKFGSLGKKLKSGLGCRLGLGWPLDPGLNATGPGGLGILTWGLGGPGAMGRAEGGWAGTRLLKMPAPKALGGLGADRDWVTEGGRIGRFWLGFPPFKLAPMLMLPLLGWLIGVVGVGFCCPRCWPKGRKDGAWRVSELGSKLRPFQGELRANEHCVLQMLSLLTASAPNSKMS